MRCIEIMTAQSRADEALGLLIAWTERHPDDVAALRHLRDVEFHDERWEELERTCAQLLDIEQGPEQVASAGMLLEACVRLGTPEHAREPLERVWAQQPSASEIRQHVRRMYELLGAHQELAKMLLEEARTMEEVGDKVAYLRWAGEALLSSGDVGSAMPALSEVLELEPDDAQARCLLADANVLLGRFAEAHALLDDVIAKSKRNAPDLYMFHHRKAYVSSAEGDHMGQLESLKKAHQAARKNAIIACELADLAEALQQWDLAVATLRTITTLDGESPISSAVALVRQGRIALTLGDDKRAKLCARRAAMTDAEAEGVQQLLADLGES
jgi:tetratricopeptide (TPR) repeat protein